MDGMTYFGRGSIKEQDTAAADLRAVRIAFAMSLAMLALTIAAALALNVADLTLPGIDQFSAIPIGA